MALQRYSEKSPAPLRDERFITHTKMQKTSQAASTRSRSRPYKTFSLIQAEVHAAEISCTLGLQDLEAVRIPRQPNRPTWNSSCPCGNPRGLQHYRSVEGFFCTWLHRTWLYRPPFMNTKHS